MYTKIIKPFIDKVIALLALIPCIPVFFITSIAIVIEDGFPIFYNAERIGQYGKLYKMYKFRSMYNNAPDIRLADGSTYNGDDDPRVTKVGKFIRKTSIDELPQILNIITGTMSLIGPRPDTPKGAHRYPKEEKWFLKVKPGITGYSQAYFRNSVDGKQKAINDMVYAQKISFVFDLKIFFRTIVTVIKRENTYKEEQVELKNKQR